jgi:hypothetical protein
MKKRKAQPWPSPDFYQSHTGDMAVQVTLIAGDGGQITINEDELCKYSSVCRMLLDPACMSNFENEFSDL